MVRDAFGGRFAVKVWVQIKAALAVGFINFRRRSSLPNPQIVANAFHAP